MQRIKTKDEVIVITGKDKGKTGRVQIFKPNGKVVVSGVNVYKKHQKPDPSREVPGDIINKEMPMDISNIAIYNKSTSKKDKVGFAVNKKGEKTRVYKSTGKEIR